MKKRGILNNDLSKLIAEMGHTDEMVICDAGLPIPAESKRIDLSLVRGIPRFLDTLKAILEDMVVEKVILAEEMKEVSPELHEKTVELLGDIEILYVSHEDFKERSSKVKGIIRTGETTPYANIILVAGVDF